MGYIAITGKIMELLETIEEIQQLYDHTPKTLAGYPAVTVNALGHTNRFNDTASNIRSYRYMIRAFVTLTDDEQAESTLQDLTDKILAVLEANVTVQNVWDIARPTEASFRFEEREIPVLVSEITVSIEKRELRNV